MPMGSMNSLRSILVAAKTNAVVDTKDVQGIEAVAKVDTTVNDEYEDTKVDADTSMTGLIIIADAEEDMDEVLRGSVESLDSAILSEIVTENKRITQGLIDSMLNRRESRTKYIVFLAFKSYCRRLLIEKEEEGKVEKEEEVDADDVIFESFVEQDSDFFDLSADSIK